MKNYKIWEYLLQIVIVVFGVFLGMLLNEWNTNRKSIDEQTLALNRILNELEEHENHLEKVVPYHTGITTVVDSILAHGNESILMKPFLMNGAWNQIPNWQGIKVFPLHTSAFEASKLSNVFANVDSELLSEITSYYEAIELYNEYCSHMTSSIFATNSNTKFMDALFIIMLIKGDLLGNEKGLLSASQKLKSKIEAQL